MKKKIRAIQYGVGPIGASIARRTPRIFAVKETSTIMEFEQAFNAERLADSIRSPEAD